MSALLFFAGAVVLVVAVRAWRPALPLRTAAAYVALTGAFFALPLFAGRLQLGTDIPYVWRPWSESVAEVRPANALMWDVVLEALPYQTLVRQQLLGGAVPRWAHELGTGQPLIGSARPFTPLHLLSLSLPPLRGLTVAIAWQMLLALLLMDALARALGAGAWGAPLAAVGFAWSTFAVLWLYNPISMTAAWLPGVVLGVVAVARREPRAFAGLVSCGLGMALGGHPEIIALGLLAVSACAAAQLVRSAPSRRLGFAARLAGGGLLVGCLAAPALLPTAEALAGSVRMLVARRPEQLQPPPFATRQLAPVISPLYFGSPVDRSWSGPAHANFYEMCSGYAGLVTLAMALAGALAFGGRWAALVAAGGVALLAALRASPVADLVQLLPGVAATPVGRARLLWVFAVALGAGLALERVAAPVRSRWVGAALLLAAAGAVACLPPDPGTTAQLRVWWAALASVGAAFAALVVPRWRPSFPAVAVAGAVVELFLLGVRVQPAIEPRFDLAPPPALSFLLRQARAAPAPFRVTAEGRDLQPNLGALYGLWDPRGYDPLRPGVAARIVAERLRAGQPAGDALQLGRPYDQPGLDFLAVRFLLLGHDRSLRPPWRLVFDGVGGRVWENPRALPLFFMPRRIAPVAGTEEAIEATLGNIDFAAAAARVGGGPAREQSGEVTLIRPRPNGFDLTLRSPTGGTVGSSVSYASGWRASVDDHGRPTFAVNGGFLGFEVPPGARRVRLDFEPPGWTWGLRLAIAGGLVALLLGIRSASGARGGLLRPGALPRA
jgi:hypothetical protein